MKTWIIAAALGISLSAAGTSGAFAQAGSTGGTLGKTDKSVAGERDDEPPQTHRISRPPPRPKDKAVSAQDSSCKDIVGTWKWYLGLSQTTFLADGSAHNSAGAAGTWKCNGASVTATWEGGVVDRYSVSRDGDSLFATSSWGGGVSFAASRIGRQ
jgi:hypothetical protein